MSMNYQEGKIYKIVSSQTDRVYIGSTYKPLYERFASHGYDFKYYMKGTYHYVSSFELLRFDDAEIHLVESYPCESKQALEIRETHWMNQYRAVIVNKQIASSGLTKLEYRTVNREKMIQYLKEYNKTRPRFTCAACNSSCNGRAKQAHLRSKKHINNQLNIDNQLDYDYAIFISDLD